MSEIIIETEKEDYQGGEEVHGRVVLIVDQAVPMRGIRIKFNGWEHSYWSTGSGKNRRTHSETRDLFDEEKTLKGKPPLTAVELVGDVLKGLFSKEHYEVLETGRYNYPFKFKLPAGLPGDFESDEGYTKITYQLKAYVDIPLRFDIKTEKKLTIYEPFDPGEARAVRVENKKEFLFDPENPLEVELALDKDIYLPGENVHGILTVTNNSAKPIKAVSIWIKQILSLKAHESSAVRHSNIQVMTLEAPDIPQGRQTRLTFNFDLPQDIYCTITTAELIKVNYELETKLHIPWAIDMKTNVPIVIVEEPGRPSGR